MRMGCAGETTMSLTACWTACLIVCWTDCWTWRTIFLHRRRNRHTDWRRVLPGLVLVDEFAYYALWFLPVGYPVVAIVDACDRVLGVVPRGEPLGKKANECFLVVWAGFFFNPGHDLKDRIGAIQYILKHNLEIFCRRPIGIVCGEYVS